MAEQPDPVTVAPPNGCALCGILVGQHGRQWVKWGEVHGWTEPSDAQRLERMKARRSARTVRSED